MNRQANLDLGVIGNGTFGALIDATTAAWCGAACRRSTATPRSARCSRPSATGGAWAVDLEDFATAEQAYLPNTAILRTILRDRHGGVVEITDFAPRWRHFNRLYRPVGLFRRVRPSGRLAAHPRAHPAAGRLGRARTRTHLGQQPHALAARPATCCA